MSIVDDINKTVLWRLSNWMFNHDEDMNGIICDGKLFEREKCIYKDKHTWILHTTFHFQLRRMVSFTQQEVVNFIGFPGRVMLYSSHFNNYQTHTHRGKQRCKQDE